MRIDDAIKQLRSLKKAGVRSVLATWWTAEDFSRQDDEGWEYDSTAAERHMDWSLAHESLSELIDNSEEEE
jgi:hypothetical protein